MAASLTSTDLTLDNTSGASIPGTPSAGQTVIYPKDDKLLYYKNDAGVERLVNITGATTAITKVFTSSNQTITSAGTLTIAHGLGVAPSLLQVLITCTTAADGYSVGDTFAYPSASGDLYEGVVVIPDATNLVCKYTDNPYVFSGINKGTGVGANFTNGNYRMILRVWA
jgi:hypothetical protein